MDIRKFNTTAACDVAQTLQLRDPFTGTVLREEDGSTVDLYLYGMHSTHGRNADAARKRKSKQGLSADEQSEIGAEFLASLTAGWSKTLEVDGEPLKYSHKAAVQLYLNEDWIARQALEFVADLSNYDPKQ